MEEHFGSSVNFSLIDLRGIKRNFALYHIPECDVYLYSTYTLDYNEQVSIVSNLRNRYPKAKHIAGGPHSNEFQEECLKIFDSLIIGEGEFSIIQAITDFMHLKLKNIYKQESSIDINIYPYPQRKYLPSSTIAREGLLTLKNTKGYDKILGTTVIFSRGCPYQCYFCTMPKMKKYTGAGVRYRSPKLVEEEIEYLKHDYNIKGISLLDEIGIPLKRNDAVSHLEAIGRSGIIWRGQCRVDGLSPELIKLMRESGCITMCLGVESVSQRSLDIINKGINVEQARETIYLLKKNNIETRIYMIIGLPGEPEDITEKTWAFIRETAPDSVYLSLFTVRPGTEVYNNPKRFGIKYVKQDWDKTMHMYGRYDKEIPELTFEYNEQTPWGKAFNNEKIVRNYIKLQETIKENGFGPVLSQPTVQD